MNDAEPVHVWEQVEIPLATERSHANPYKQVTVWVDLEGPGFSRRCYGFWDDGATFRVRVVATAPGEWRWRSGSEPADPGLSGRSGSFVAVEWSEEEKRENPCRRGFIRPTPNGHAFQHADGTPFFLLGDTWWPAGTFRYLWRTDDKPRRLGPGVGFKDVVRCRLAQEFNSVAIIAAFPAWANDMLPPTIQDQRGVSIRNAWEQAGTMSAKDMHDEYGNRPFFFPGRVPGFESVFPDVEQPNPHYFRNLDRKVAYLNARGIVPFVEVARRDVGQAWKAYYEWPDSYSRYVQYVWSRLQASNCLLSPIHFDWDAHTIPAEEWNEPANLVIDRYGPPPFGQPVGPNSAGSSLRCFGHTDAARWLSFHQLGNRREHCHYALLAEAFRAEPPVPCLNGEPYYDGGQWGTSAPAGSELSALYCRSGFYGSVLSGGLAGHIHGAEGLWGGDVEEQAEHTIWDALEWPGADDMRHGAAFVLSEGARYQALEPDPDCVEPSRRGDPNGYTGWAYCARTAERDLALLYFERDCPRGTVSGLTPGATYGAEWFDPRKGEWLDALPLGVDSFGAAQLPPFPGAGPARAPADWALKLKRG
jgi:hypothetical protein